MFSRDSNIVFFIVFYEDVKEIFNLRSNIVI